MPKDKQVQSKEEQPKVVVEDSKPAPEKKPVEPKRVAEVPGREGVTISDY